MSREGLLQENTKLCFVHSFPFPKKNQTQKLTIIPKTKSDYFISLSGPRDAYLFQEII